LGESVPRKKTIALITALSKPTEVHLQLAETVVVLC